MPSIFTRSRTASTPNKSQSSGNGNGNGLYTDEFGRVTSRGSTHNNPSPSSTKKDKKKGDARQRTQSAAERDGIDIASLPDGSFLPFSWGLLRQQQHYPHPHQKQQHQQQEQQPEDKLHMRNYGYLSYKSEVVLGIEDVSRLVEVISHELNERGLTTPLLFSNTALDISRTRIHRLIDTFLDTCPHYTFQLNSAVDLKWRDEARFAGPHELGMTLRWGLARLLRVHHGQETRGFVAWEHYLQWRDQETAANYPSHAFQSFLPSLSPPTQALLLSLMDLFSRLTTHATSSGLTPPTLATHFGPLLFGLGSPSLPFHHTYGAYLRCSHATEHLLLAFVRAQPPPHPKRLLDWVRGYPSMIQPLQKLDKARPGAKVMRLNTVRRHVRLYSRDLVRSAAGWDMAGTGSREWGRVTGSGVNVKLLGGVKYSDPFRKKMDLPVGAVPDGVEAEAEEVRRRREMEAEEEQWSVTGAVRSGGGGGKDASGKRALEKEDEGRFGSLTELKWGEFESLGFGGEATAKRLEFDLNEGARLARTEKRATLTWSDFSTAGFSRNDAPLSATLQFSAPVQSTIQAWPQRQNELQHKLKKTQKSLPPFTWDTMPILGGEEAVEAGFVDVFCDLVYGSGWVDRKEQTWRECNWAVVEYKSIPQNPPRYHPHSTPPADPRTATSLWLYEEFIPPEYRAQLSAGPKRKIPFPFRSHAHSSGSGGGGGGGGGGGIGGGSTVGFGKAIPRIPNARELEFEGLLKSAGNVTKVISLNGGAGRTVTTMSGGGAGTPITIGVGGISGPLYVVGKDGTSGADAYPSSSVGSSATTMSRITRTNTKEDVLPPTPMTATTATTVTATGAPTELAYAASLASGPATPTLPQTQTQPPQTKRSRFPLPTMPSPSLRRKARPFPTIPAEYDATLEFETRTMWDDGRSVHSGEEEEQGTEDGEEAKRGNESSTMAWGKQKRSKKRESQDDAWVDILVGSQSRRMEGQTAMLKRPGTAESTAGGAEVKSKKRVGVIGSFGEADRVQEEVRRALREAGPEPVDVFEYEGSSNASHHHYSGGGKTSVGSRPRTSHSEEEAERGDSDVDDEELYGPPERSQRQHTRRVDSASLDSADFEPMPHMRAPSDRGGGGDVTPTHLSAPTASSLHPHPPLPPKHPSKGVGSLIEMYKEKEKEAGRPSVPGPSKIPVRSTSLEAAVASSSSSKPMPAIPPIVPSHKPMPTPIVPSHTPITPTTAAAADPQTQEYELVDDDASSVVPSEMDEQELEEYLKRHVKISSSTPRYVHGAPLHNVVEIEEEED